MPGITAVGVVRHARVGFADVGGEGADVREGVEGFVAEGVEQFDGLAVGVGGVGCVVGGKGYRRAWGLLALGFEM
jgi:hypothetical protein